MVSTHPGGAQEIPGIDPGWSTQILRIAQSLEAILADHGALTGLLDTDHDHGLSLTAASLLDDDHSQYALLAGRSGGQTVIGGTASGDDLTLHSTSHATKGMIAFEDVAHFHGALDEAAESHDRVSIGIVSGTPRILFEDGASATLWEIDNFAGVFRLFTPGVPNLTLSATTFTVGPGTSINGLISGYLRAGSASAPTNTTAGDLTATRLKVVDGAFGTGVDFSVTGDGALSGFLRVGSETAPTNVTAGDLTAIRLNVGNVAFGTGVEAQIQGDAAISGFLGVGSASAPANTTAGDITGTRLFAGRLESLSGNLDLRPASGIVHILPVGTPDVNLEVSDGATTGAGSIHRASSGAHSSRRLKSEITPVNRGRAALAEVRAFQHVTFKYKVNNLKPDGTLRDPSLPPDALLEDPTRPIHLGLIYEDVPESIRGPHEDIIIDKRIALLEMAVKEIINRIPALQV